MVFAHAFSDIVVNRILEPFWKFKNITKRQELIVWITGVLSTIFPDIDLIYAVIVKEQHRYMITHTFVPYVIAAFVIMVLSFVFSKILKNSKKDFLEPAFIRLLVPIMVIGVAMHLLTDTLGAPVRLLYPFSNREFVTFQINSFLHSQNLNAIFQYYTTPIFFAIETFWIATGSFIIYKKTQANNYIKKYLPQTLGLVVASAATMLVIVLMSNT